MFHPHRNISSENTCDAIGQELNEHSSAMLRSGNKEKSINYDQSKEAGIRIIYHPGDSHFGKNFGVKRYSSSTENRKEDANDSRDVIVLADVSHYKINQAKNGCNCNVFIPFSKVV